MVDNTSWRYDFYILFKVDRDGIDGKLNDHVNRSNVSP